MWVVDNRTPFAAAGTFIRDRQGGEVWIVAVKATYSLLPDGSTKVSECQEPVCRTPHYFGEPGLSSLKYDLDLVPVKLATDVILHGHAHAPEGEEVKQVSVGLRVGSIHKRLVVTGDRRRRRIFSFLKTPTHPFSRLPLLYENAWGGRAVKNSRKKRYEARNPVGRGFGRGKGDLKMEMVPNITKNRLNLMGKPSPAGFGPIPSHWEPRSLYGGTYDETWERTRMPLLPDDFDDRFYQQAPEDQQVEGFLKGGEVVTLENLKGHGIFRFVLPDASLAFETVLENLPLTHGADLHTVIIEPDRERVMMVWQTALACHNREHLLERTIVRIVL